MHPLAPPRSAVSDLCQREALITAEAKRRIITLTHIPFITSRPREKQTRLADKGNKRHKQRPIANLEKNNYFGRVRRGFTGQLKKKVCSCGKIETLTSSTGGILILCRRTGEKILRKNENCKKDLLSDTR